jgi:hypothetical protein
MTQDFAQHFILLRRLRLAAEPFPELALNHREGHLDVRTLVVVLHELFRVVRVVMERAAEEVGGLTALGVGAKVSLVQE